MASAMPVAGAVGGLVSGAGAILKGQTTANSLNAQAASQEEQAKEASQAADYNVFKSQLNASMAQGRASAAYGAAGVSSSSTSAQAVLMAGAQNAELDRQNILLQSEYRSINYANQASLDRMGANSALEGSYFQALGSALGGSSNLLGNMVGSGSPGSDGAMTPANLDTGETASLQNNIAQLNPSFSSGSISPEKIDEEGL